MAIPLLVSSYPAMPANFNPTDVLRQVVEQLLNSEKSPDRRDLLDDLLHMISCKAAVKAGDRLSREEVQTLLEQRHHYQDAHHCPARPSHGVGLHQRGTRQAFQADLRRPPRGPSLWTAGEPGAAARTRRVRQRCRPLNPPDRGRGEPVRSAPADCCTGAQVGSRDFDSGLVIAMPGAVPRTAVTAGEYRWQQRDAAALNEKAPGMNPPPDMWIAHDLCKYRSWSS